MQEWIRRAGAPAVLAAIVEAAVRIVVESTGKFVGGRSVGRVDYETARAAG